MSVVAKLFHLLLSDNDDWPDIPFRVVHAMSDGRGKLHVWIVVPDNDTERVRAMYDSPTS